MKWLQDNPVGTVLASVSGVLVLLALVMAIIWALPVPVKINELEAGEKSGTDNVLVAPKIAEMRELGVINEKPVFNESRLPVVAAVDEQEVLEDTSVAVKDAPDVRLTGVVITPDKRIVTLTPATDGPEMVVAQEGESLIGEHVAWHVDKVNSRTVVLKSSDGQQLELELQVHDTKIEEPPKPTPVAAAAVAAAQAGRDQDGQQLGEDGQPLSRAEQIRQRIAERREELRLEQEARAAQPQAQEREAQAPAARSGYQNAIRNLMNKSDKDQDSNDKKDG